MATRASGSEIVSGSEIGRCDGKVVSENEFGGFGGTDRER
jgi:hypothetical protein